MTTFNNTSAKGTSSSPSVDAAVFVPSKFSQSHDAGPHTAAAAAPVNAGEDGKDRHLMEVPPYITSCYPFVNPSVTPRPPTTTQSASGPKPFLHQGQACFHGGNMRHRYPMAPSIRYTHHQQWVGNPQPTHVSQPLVMGPLAAGVRVPFDGGISSVGPSLLPTPALGDGLLPTPLYPPLSLSAMMGAGGLSKGIQYMAGLPVSTPAQSMLHADGRKKSGSLGVRRGGGRGAKVSTGTQKETQRASHNRLWGHTVIIKDNSAQTGARIRARRKMAKGSQSEDAKEEEMDLELELDLMTISCFEKMDDAGDDDLGDQLFITCCYGRGKALRDVVLPRLPKNYEREVKDLRADFATPVEFPVMKSPATKTKQRTGAGRGRAQLLQDQFQTNEKNLQVLQAAQSRHGVQRLSDLPPFSLGSRERRSDSVLIDQEFDSLDINSHWPGSNSWVSSAIKYNVRSQEEFPRLSTDAESDSKPNKTSRRVRRKQFPSLKALSQEISSPEASDSNEDRSGESIEPDGKMPASGISSLVEQALASRLHEMRSDNDDGRFDDVAVEGSDGVFEAVRKHRHEVSPVDLATRTSLSQAAIDGTLPSKCSDNASSSLFDVDDIDDMDIEDSDSGKETSRTCEDGTVSESSDAPHCLAPCSDSGVAQSCNGSSVDEHILGRPPIAIIKTETELVPETNDPTQAEENSGTGSDDSAGAKGQSSAGKKLKSRKAWKLEGSDVVQFDNVPKNEEKELETLVSHYGKILEKEKKSRNGGKCSIRFRISEDSQNMDWIAECFHGNDGIFPGYILECYHLTDANAEGTEV